MYLIHGCFFQTQQWLGVAMAPQEGLVAVVEEGLIWDMYAGVIRSDPRRGGQLVGGMLDNYGASVLSEISITDAEVSFTKKYQQRTDSIRYMFKMKDGLLWAGEYEGSVVGKGLSRCLVTEVSDTFNDPHSLMKVLGVASPHEWTGDSRPKSTIRRKEV